MTTLETRHNAALKAWATRRLNAQRRKAALKAWETRRAAETAKVDAAQGFVPPEAFES